MAAVHRKKKKLLSSNNSMEMAAAATSSVFCESITFHILTFLPVRSLLRFRSVCKFWLSLIDSPHFVRTHSLTSSSKRTVYLATRDVSGYLLFRDGDAPSVENLWNSWILSQVWPSPSTGLVAFVDYEGRGAADGQLSLCVCNPSTREFVKILGRKDPFLDISFNIVPAARSFSSYHVIRVPLSVGEPLQMLTVSGEEDVDRLEWTKLENSQLQEMVPSHQRFLNPVVNGNLHLVYYEKKNKKQRGRKTCIVVVDLAKGGNFRFIDPPPCTCSCGLDNAGTCSRDLMVELGKKIYLFHVEISAVAHVDVWVLKDYAKGEWSREGGCNLELACERAVVKSGTVEVVGVAENSVLMEFDFEYEYRVDGMKRRVLGFYDVGKRRMGIYNNRTALELGLRIHGAFLESLVSPKCGRS